MPSRRPPNVTSSLSPTRIVRRPTAANRRRLESATVVADTSAVARGLFQPLSAREFEVLALLREGFSCSEISVRLGISPRTAWAHLGALKRKLAAATAAHCVARGFERKLLK